MRIRTQVSVLAAVAAMGCAPDSPVAIDQQMVLSRTVKMVPAKGQHTNERVPVVGDPCPDGAVATAAVGSGIGSHLGRYTLESLSCGVVTGLGTFAFVSSEITWTAANGDKISWGLDLTVPNVGVVDFGSLPLLPFTWMGEYDVVAGTGRFEGATGHMAQEVTGDLTLPRGEASWEGTISSPGSIKWANP